MGVFLGGMRVGVFLGGMLVGVFLGGMRVAVFLGGCVFWVVCGCAYPTPTNHTRCSYPTATNPTTVCYRTTGLLKQTIHTTTFDSHRCV